MTGADDLVTYLGDHAPFRSMSPEALAELASAVSTHTFGVGDLIVDYTTEVPDEIWMLRSGAVALLADSSEGAEPVDAVTPGGVFGYFPLLSGGQVKFAARAAEPSTLLRLPGALVRSVFTKPAGLSFLASSAWDIISTRTRAEQPSLIAVGDLVRDEPVFTSAATTVRDAVRHMTDQRASYALIALPSGDFGIFTDRDLRTRVVAAGAGLDVAIGQVMSAPARTVTADRVAATVLMDMLESGLRHMPVVDHRGRVLGVVEDTDLVASSTRQSFLVRRSIALAADPVQLKAAAGRITDLVVDLFRGGTDAAGTSAILSVVIDAVVRRALDLELAGQSGQWRDQFAWLTLGSIARREAMPSSDVDSALSWADAGTAEKGRLRRLATAVHATLDLCGLPSDSNGAVASSPRFARSASEWAVAAEGWLDDPMKDRGIVMSCCFWTPGWSGATANCTPSRPHSAGCPSSTPTRCDCSCSKPWRTNRGPGHCATSWPVAAGRSTSSAMR